MESGFSPLFSGDVATFIVVSVDTTRRAGTPISTQQIEVSSTPLKCHERLSGEAGPLIPPGSTPHVFC